MKNFDEFKKQLLEAEKESEKDSKSEKPQKKAELEPVAPESSVGEWKKTESGWVIKFTSQNEPYVLSLSPLDSAEKHWKFIYYKEGQRDSSDINKFGPMADWKAVWETIISILKEFIKLFRPDTIKFIGMSISKRGTHYKHLFKLFIKHYRHAFRKQSYVTSFDSADLSSAPSFVIRKHISSDVEKKSSESKNEK